MLYKRLRGIIMNRKITIALDGPSGSGKSTVAKRLSQELDILYLDTGAMYRAVALEAIKRGVDTFDEKEVSEFIGDLDLEIKYENGAQRTILDGEDVSEKIREPQVSMAASNVSSLKCVRLKMVEMQRKETLTMFMDKLERLPELSKEELEVISKNVKKFR